MDLNLFERGIANISPKWGAHRLLGKVALEQALIAARSFDAARRDRRTEGWRATGGSANAELAPSLALIRRRSRDLCRNNEWGVNAKRKLVSHIIGTGIMPRPNVTAARAKKAASDAWASFVENCDPEGLTDYYGIQAKLIGEVVEGGAAFLRWYVRPPGFKHNGMSLKVPLQCEVLEHDFLDTQRTEIKTDGNVIIHGVEYNGYGQRVAYWLFPVHPGELNTITRRGSNFLSQRVPATECDHVFRLDRAGQVTGVPWLAPAMLRLRDVADYEEAELIRKKIEACFTVFVRRNGTSTTGIAQSVDQSTDKNSRRLEKIAPGLIAHLQDGEEISTAAPTPGTGATEHMDRQLYAFAAGVGLTYAQASGNLSGANFSSMREGKLDFWAVLDHWQYFMTIPQACRPAWRRVMQISAGRGLQVAADTPAIWTPPKRPWVDPLKDIKAKREEIAAGLASWREEAAAAGYDPDELLKEITQDMPLLKAAGLSPGATPGMAPANDGQNAKTEEEENDQNSK